MPTLAGPEGPIEVRVTGAGQPTTVYAHGLAASIDETRPFGSGVRGRGVYFHFRGHGVSGPGESPWSYAAVESELRAVLHRYAARRALGVSLGAGALLQAAVRTPQDFDQVVFVLPPALDEPRTDGAVAHWTRMAELVERGDADALAELVESRLPEEVRGRPSARNWARRRARRLTGTAIARGLRAMPRQHPLVDRADLARVRCPVLVIGQQEDDLHPATVARDLARALPDARLKVFDRAGLLWRHRQQVRELISGFLNQPADAVGSAEEGAGVRR